MVLERQIFLQKEGRNSVQHVLHYPTVPMKVKTPALVGEVNLGCLFMHRVTKSGWRTLFFNNSRSFKSLSVCI